ncbi:S24 family peptidase [Actinopolymorpha sp. B17G11]|uniref:S24 family peptidase n=1 Tax=Actinopolymorpha sp. B17G11 TaxID=3160861 RepID=UPI0032E36B43
MTLQRFFVTFLRHYSCAQTPLRGTFVSKYGIAIVRGRSMLPTLRDGDRLLVAYARTPRPGSLVLVVLPGGRPLSVKRLVRREPDGGWWVERDNPREGIDSWHVGAIPEGDLVAVVVARLRVVTAFVRLRDRLAAALPPRGRGRRRS